MSRPTMRRLAATVVASAVLAGGLAAGSGAASAAPAGSLLPAESVAAMPTFSTGGVENVSPIEFVGGVFGTVFVISAIFLWNASGSAPAPCPTYGGCNQ